MAILIDNRQDRMPMDPETLRKKAQVVLNALGSPDAELSLVIVDDDEIATLNHRYLNRQGPTNVIAFPMQEGEFSGVSPGLLGDVVISADTARREALDAGLPPEQRFDELMVHGILHLLGYDHENDEEKARAMEAKTVEIMALLAGAES